MASNSGKYDILIIGSGYGGLTCGYILSKAGYKVCILEKHAILGGFLQTFSRKGVKFDTGIHYVGSFDEGQAMNRFFRYLGILDEIPLRKLSDDAFDIHTFKGEEYKFATGFDNFTESLSRIFPSEHKNIFEYIRQIKNYTQSIDLYNFKEITDLGFDKLDLFRKNANEVICNSTNNTKLREILAAFNMLHAGKRETTSYYLHALISNHYIEGSYRFVDGSDSVVSALKKRIISNGGELLTNQEVKKLLFSGNKLIGVKTKNGDDFLADNVISNIHPSETMKMIEPGILRKAYRNRLMNLKNTTSVFSMYIIFKPGKFPYLNSNHYYYRGNSTWCIDSSKESDWPNCIGFFPMAESDCFTYTRAVSVIAYMNFNDVENWLNTNIGQRGEDYKAFKEEKAKIVFEALEEKFPGIKNATEAYYTASPLTYRDYTSTTEGSIYGIERNCLNPIESYILPKTKIPNLFFTGQNMNVHGMLGVSVGAILTCGEFLGVNKLMKEISNV